MVDMKVIFKILQILSLSSQHLKEPYGKRLQDPTIQARSCLPILKMF